MATTTIALKTRKSRPGQSGADKAPVASSSSSPSSSSSSSSPSSKKAAKGAAAPSKDELDTVAYSELAVRNNAAIMDYCRTSMSALGGATAGIMGLTSFYGFIFYFISALLLSVMLMVKAGSRWNKYFVSRRVLFVTGLFGGLFTYILFWTFLYGMVHVY